LNARRGCEQYQSTSLIDGVAIPTLDIREGATVQHYGLGIFEVDKCRMHLARFWHLALG
jgi:hypothetical protein